MSPQAAEPLPPPVAVRVSGEPLRLRPVPTTILAGSELLFVPQRVEAPFGQ
jgi:hypothetical protein